ncbi:beta strand repeat-containing protein, partial [Burkholderia cepacia]
MNKTYRTVWNATTGTWTAAAETARMRTKSKTNTAMRSSVTAAVAVMAGVGGVAMSADANAQAANGGGSLSLCAPSGSGYYGTTFGGGNTVGTRTTAACGTAISNFRLSEGHVRSFQLYNNSNVNGGGVGQASAATEAGISGTVDGHLFLLGGSGVHLRGPVDVDSNFNMTNHRINNLAAGTAGTDAVNVNQLNAAIAAAGTANPYVVTNTGTYAAATAARAGGSATAIGANANAGGTSAVALGGNTVATGQNAVALGTLANATGAETVAVGVSARATGNNSTAMGRGAAAVSTNATSVGYSAYAGADGATALGTTASAVGANAIAVGRGASTSGTYGSAIGYSANATTNAVAIGVLANATSASSVALGERASATGSTATALGRGALASGTNAVALGANSVGDRNNAVSVGSTSLQRQITNVAAGTQNTDAVNLGQMNAAIAAGSNPYVAVRGSTAARASGTQSIAIGDGAIANATNTNGGQTNIAVGAKAYTSGGFGQLAIGEGASATNANAGGAIAIGRGAMTTQRGVALGDGASVTAQYGVALGDTSVADRANSVSVGSASLQRQITNVAAGTQNTDAVNLGQMNTALSTKVDNTYVKINGGGNAATATGSQATAIGANASATSASATAIGDNTLAGGFATAVGHLASATGGTSVAVGGGATASGSMASAFGRNTVASGARSAAIGNMAVASGDDANAFGNSSTASGARSATLGYNAKATAADSVAIGSNSDTGTRTFAVSVGSATQQRQIVNVAAGTQATDAVNVGQLSGVTKALGGGAAVDGSGNVKQPTYKVAGTDYHNVGDALDALAANGSSDPNAVTYDGATKDKVTLKGAGGTTLSNVKAGVANMDAVNVGQLKGSGLIGDDGKSIAAVTYDRNADGTPNMGSVTLGGAGATTPVALKNVADAKDNHDALNLGQLKDAGLVGDDGKGNLTSMAVTYDGAARDKVTLGGADGTTLSNVKAGVADMDAVNVSQLKGSGLIGDDGKSIAAVTYDRNADGTPNYGTVTLGNGAGPTQIKNVATGVDDLDAVNVKQLNTGLSDLRDEMSGGNLRFVKVNADPVTGTPAVASGALAVAIGSDARATSANSLALGSGARVTGDGSVAIGYNSVANQSNVVSVGDVGSERKIVNVADGDVAFQSTDAVNGGQLYAALNDLSTSVSSKTQQAIDNFSSEIDKKTKAAIDEVGSRSMQPMDVSDPLVAIEGLKGNNVASLNGADPATATAAAIGSSTAASGANAVAVGLQSGAGSNNSVAIGSFAQTGAGQDYSVAVGSNVQTNGTQAVALGANAQANGNYALAVGNNGAQAIGDGSVAVGNAANVRAGSTNAIAIGTGANVARSVEGAMALGANATAGAANSVALGANSFSNRANALSVGRAGAERQIVNVAAGTQATDAVNVSQLKGVTDALGGGAAVGADGTVTSPTYSLADPTDATKSKSYNNVGDALSNLDGRTTTNTQNITVINKQLADSGLVDPATGQSITAVTYDRNADGTPNLGSVTLGGAGATTPVALKNVADAKDDHDALNLGQLKDAGLVGDDGKGNLTSMAVTYDGAARDKVTLGGADGTTLANVKAGVADMDAVNVSQLKGSGLIGDDGKANAAVTYDRNADGTPNYG